MPRLDTTARAKSVEPTRSTGPVSPHNIKLPNTPAAIHHSNPLEAVSSSSKSSPGKDNVKPVSRHEARAGSLPPTSPPTSRAPVSPPVVAPVLEQVEESSSEEIIHQETFNQILEMDDDDDHEFSLSIVENYFDQAKETFGQMTEFLGKKDLKRLSELGHFLKGSSAAIGVQKVQETCERIQNLGKVDPKLAGPTKEQAEKKALDEISACITRVQKEFAEAEQWLKKYFNLP